jgi:methionyl aminopeptidase
MDQQIKEKYIEAGRVLKKARNKAREVSEPGTPLLEIAEEIESLVRNEGLQPAFPVNLSVNEEAAHYSPGLKKDRKLSENDVMKVDIGVHCDGYIADSAITINPSGKYAELIEENERVLKQALDFLEPGVTVGELGTHIQNQIPDKYSVVRNLTGHALGQYEQHAGLSIPNISNSNNNVFEKGDAVAIEPFLSTGSGKIKEGKKGNIYLYQGGNVRGREARKLLKQIKEFHGLPFSSRWLNMNARQKMSLKKLVKNNVIKHYPILRDSEAAVVSQAEHTVLVGVDDGENIVTTME